MWVVAACLIATAGMLPPAARSQTGSPDAANKQGASPKKPSAADLEAAREYIERYLSPEKRKKLDEIAKARGLSPAETFLTLTAVEKQTLGEDSALPRVPSNQ